MNFLTLDLNLLRVFDKLMAEGSLTRAAETLAITQPAASHALKRLHDAVGETLFVRTAFGMKPTAKAEAIWPAVRDSLAVLQRALAPDAFNPQADEANFRLAMADAAAAMLAPQLVARVEELRARANLRVLPVTTRDPRPALDNSEVDLAVGHFPDAVTGIMAAGDHATHRHLQLYDTSYACVMRRDHPLAKVDLTLDAYCAAHHMLVSVSGRRYGLVDHTLAAMGRRRRVVITVNQYFTAGRVLTRSDLLTVLPSSSVPATGHEGQLVVRPLPFDLGGVPVTMIWHVRRETDPAQRWLRALVQQASAELAALGPALGAQGLSPSPALPSAVGSLP